MTEKRTDLPWSVRPADSRDILGRDGKTVAIVYGLTAGDSITRDMVIAVNAHDGLLASCKCLCDAMELHEKEPWLIAEARKVIAAAEGDKK